MSFYIQFRWGWKFLWMYVKGESRYWQYRVRIGCIILGVTNCDLEDRCKPDLDPKHKLWLR